MKSDNWNFLDGKVESSNITITDDKNILINGHVREIQNPELSDFEVAGRVRMLMRSDLGHEAVCTMARDRIVYLAEELRKVRAAMRTLEGFARAAIQGFDELVGESVGVAGLHMNGDLAPWSELAPGGQFEEWTGEIDALRQFLAGNTVVEPIGWAELTDTGRIRRWTTSRDQAAIWTERGAQLSPLYTLPRQKVVANSK